MLKSRAKKLVTGLLAIFLISATVFAVWYWETVGKSSILYQDVVLTSRDIKAGEVITVDDLIIGKVDGTSISKNALLEVDAIINKKALVDIPEGMQLSGSYFIESNYYLEDGKTLLKIPSDWILSLPSTVRRGDVVYLYPVKQKKANQDDVYTFDKPSNDFAAKFTVIYAKSNGAKEVKDDRIEGTDQVTFIEVHASLTEITKLNDLIQSGHKFIITYK